MLRDICIDDLEFQQVQVNSFASDGTPYRRWKRVGMPKISQDVIAATFYLYRNKEDAIAGVKACGTGFIVSYGLMYYGVTNRHVARDQGASVIRLNVKDGVRVLEFTPDEWDTIPDGDDIAVITLDLEGDSRFFQTRSINISMFAIPGSTIGVGDDVFMLGLFVDHEGIERNNPMARFGNISMLANANSPIVDNNRQYESFIVDMHSRSGFSGSPVFVYRTIGGDLTQHFGERIKVNTNGIIGQLNNRSNLARGTLPSNVDVTIEAQTMFALLGIHWGQFSERWELAGLKSIAEDAKAKHLTTDETFVKGFSGMTCVAPAWKIAEVLNMKKFIDQREDASRKLKNESGLILESAPIAQTGDDLLKRMLNTPPTPHKGGV